MPKQTLRITIPTNVEDLLKLGARINEKHTADGANSPLKVMQDYKWDTIGPKLSPALAKHLEAEKYRRDMEKAYQDRDIMMGDIKGIVTSTRDFLKGTYSKTPKTLGDYGFTVD